MIKKILLFFVFCCGLHAESSPNSLVTIFCGPMCSEKTKQLMDDVITFQENGGIPLTISYYQNSRDDGVIKSRSYPDQFLTPSCSFGQLGASLSKQILKKINNFEVSMDDIYSKCQIFIDEFQFMTTDELDELKRFIDEYKVKTNLYGLNLNFKRQPFAAFEYACEIFQPQIFYKEAMCEICHEHHASFTARFCKNKFCTDGQEVLIEGSAPEFFYASVCENCWGKDIK